MNAVNIRTREEYWQPPEGAELAESKAELLQVLDRWKQQVESGQLIAILMVGVRPSFGCTTYCGLDETLPNTVELGAVQFLLRDVQRRVMGD